MSTTDAGIRQLKNGNVDLQEGVIRIEQQMQYHEGLVKLNKSTNSGGSRTRL